MPNIFSLNTLNSLELTKYYSKAFSELKEFFDINWIYDLPKLYIIKDRQSIDAWKNEENTNMSGWTYGSHQFYIISKQEYAKEKGENFSEEDYFMLLKHEMAHCFYQVKTQGITKPVWLWEGVAIFASGQTKHTKPPEKFEMFLNSQETHQNGVYKEAGHAVQFLVEKFGRGKLLDLLSELSKESFEKSFKNIYGLDASYEFFNGITPTREVMQ